MIKHTILFTKISNQRNQRLG
jgi:hypothetical protein